MSQKNPEEYKAYMRAYMKQRYHERHAETREILGGVCAFPGCDRTENLEIDHIDWRKKTMKVDRMAWVGRKRFLEELQLCQLLCEEHHMEKSRTDISEIRQEETRTGFRKNGKRPQRVRIPWPEDNALLAALESSSYADVARQLGCSNKSVRNRIQQIKNKGKQNV